MKSLVTFCLIFLLIPGVNAEVSSASGLQIAKAARQQVGVTRTYNPGYVTLAYPGGDVPLHTGVCSDVLVRALRQVGIDLQQTIHEDMQKHFSAYPKKWGLKRPDKNIDHRRVPNLMRYFERQQIALHGQHEPPESYRPGDMVAWNLGNGILHVGIVSDRAAGSVPLIIHNIGAGAREEDILFKYQVIGHYRIKNIPQQSHPVNRNRTNRPGINTTVSAN